MADIKYLNSINLLQNQLKNHVLDSYASVPAANTTIEGQILYDSSNNVILYNNGSALSGLVADISVNGTGSFITGVTLGADSSRLVFTRGNAPAHANGYGKVQAVTDATGADAGTVNTNTCTATSSTETIKFKGGNKWITTGASNGTAGNDIFFINHTLNGLSYTGDTITVGLSADSSSTSFNIPYLTFDKAGHATGIAQHSMSLGDIFAEKSHTHGNITNAGTINSSPNRAVVTNASSEITAIDISVNSIGTEDSDYILSKVTQDSKGKITVTRENRTITTTLGADNTTVPTSKAVKDAIDGALAAGDAMIYKGTYTAQATSTTVVASGWSTPPTTESLGWTWKVTGVSGSTAFFGNIRVENGDMIIAVVENPGQTVANYNVIQANLVIGAQAGQIPDNGAALSASCSVATDASSRLNTVNLTFGDASATTSGSATTFVSSVTANAYGKISVTKKAFDSSNLTKLAFKTIATSAASTVATATTGNSNQVNIVADASDDTATFSPGNKWITIYGDANADTITFGHAAPDMTGSVTDTSATGTGSTSMSMVTGVTRDATGHVVKVLTKTFPDIEATDEKVSPVPASDASAYPLLIVPNSNTPTNNGKPKYVAGVTLQPNTKTIVATNFNGTATAATHIGTDGSYQAIGSTSQPVYVNSTGVVAVVTAVGVRYGGTGKTAWTQGSIPYLTDTTTFGELTRTVQGSNTGSVFTASNTDTQVPSSKAVYNAIDSVTSLITGKDYTGTFTIPANSGSITTAHNLGSKNVIVSVYDAAYNQIYCDVKADTSLNVVLTFGKTGALGNTQGRICVHRCD